MYDNTYMYSNMYIIFVNISFQAIEVPESNVFGTKMVKENRFIDSQKLENDDGSTYTKDSKISVQKLSKLDSSSLFTRSVSGMLSSFVYMNMEISMCIHMCVNTYMYICMCAYINMHICMFLCVY
jgi:hypothetical protein